MIVSTFTEAIPIVNAVPKRKTIGYACIQGELHDGHRAVIAELKRRSGYAIVSTALVSCGVDDPEYIFAERWGHSFPFTRIIKTLPPADLAELDSLVDLVITSSKPIPPVEDMTAIRQYAADNYESVRRQYDPMFLIAANQSLNMDNALNISNFMSFKYILDNYFKFQVRVTSWKEGLRRFIDADLFKSLLGVDVYMLPPTRGADGLAYNRSFFSTAELDSLRTKIQTLKSTVTLKTATYWDIRDVLLPEWELVRFERLQGPLIDKYGGVGAVYYHVGINSIPSIPGSIYFDSFLLS